MGIGIILQCLLNEKNTNVNEVATATGVSPSTLYSIIKRDSMKASIDDLYKVAHYLGVTLDYFYSNYQAQLKSSPIKPLSCEAEEVARAYDKADFKSKNSARYALDLPMLVAEDNLSDKTSSASDKQTPTTSERVSEAEEEYIKSMSAGAPNVASSASNTTDGKNEKAV